MVSVDKWWLFMYGNIVKSNNKIHIGWPLHYIRYWQSFLFWVQKVFNVFSDFWYASRANSTTASDYLSSIFEPIYCHSCEFFFEFLLIFIGNELFILLIPYFATVGIYNYLSFSLIFWICFFEYFNELIYISWICAIHTKGYYLSSHISFIKHL